MIIFKKIIIILVPLILGIIATVFQFANATTLSQRELTLISAVQFISSLWFGWVVASLFSEKEFQQKQRKFALSAYRRIREIEMSVDRLLERVGQKKGSNSVINSELEVIGEIVRSLQTTVSSSKSDWAGVIDEDIKNLEEIEQIGKTEFTPTLEKKEKTQQLLAKLPAELKIQAREIIDSRERINTASEEMKKEFDNSGSIEFVGFWDPSFEKDIHELEVGSKIFVTIDDVEGRVGAFIAHSEVGENLGVIMNNLAGLATYHEFTQVVMNVLGCSKFVGEFSSKDEVYKPKNTKDKHLGQERHYFKVKVKK